MHSKTRTRRSTQLTNLHGVANSVIGGWRIGGITTFRSGVPIAVVAASVMELLVNGQVAMTKRFYPAGDHAQDVRLHWTGSTQPLAELTVWHLSPISSDRFTT